MGSVRIVNDVLDRRIAVHIIPAAVPFRVLGPGDTLSIGMETGMNDIEVRIMETTMYEGRVRRMPDGELARKE